MMDFLYNVFCAIWTLAGCLVGLSAVIALVMCIVAMLKGVRRDV